MDGVDALIVNYMTVNKYNYVDIYFCMTVMDK